MNIKRNLNLLRKTAASGVIRLCLEPLKLLPVKKNRVLFSSYMEKQYSCSPRYISRELKRLAGDKVEIGWAFRHPEDFRFLEKEGIRVMGTKTWEFIKFALTSRVVVTNTYYKPSLPRRKRQFFIQTWHGSGAYKKVGRHVDMPLIERINTRMREGRTDLFLSGCTFFTQHVIRDAFDYRGEVYEYGMPRNDIMLCPPDNEALEEIRARAGVPKGVRLCLFAPTYRKDTKVHASGLDYERVLSALEKRFGGQWVMGYRSHHVSMFKDQSIASKGALDLSLYSDMQELLLISDALITDYSSSIWDAALANKRVFLFAPDLKEYSLERDFYTDIHSWPFPLSESNDELVSNIERFDEGAYAEKVKKHLEDLGNCESGRASYFAAQRIMKETGLSNDH